MQKLNIRVLKITKMTNRMTDGTGRIFGCWKIRTLRQVYTFMKIVYLDIFF